MDKLFSLKRTKIFKFLAVFVAFSFLSNSIVMASPDAATTYFYVPPEGEVRISDEVLICGAGGSQEHPDMISDSNGNTIVVCEDSRNGDKDIYAQKIDPSGRPLWGADENADGIPDGVPVIEAVGNQLNPLIISDGSNGAIVVWIDDPNGDFTGSGIIYNVNIYVQRIDTDGNTVWNIDGNPLCISALMRYWNHESKKWHISIIPDGVGGAIIVWEDYRSGDNNSNLYARRVNSDGSINDGEWPSDGLPICTANGIQKKPELISDGVGGAIIVWEDWRDGSRYRSIYAQKIQEDAGGRVQLLWGADGVPVDTGIGNDYCPVLVSDASGGAIVAWKDAKTYFSGFMCNGVYTMRIDGNGDGVWSERKFLGALTSANLHLRIAPDESGGAIVAWEGKRGFFPTPRRYDVFVQTIDRNGELSNYSTGKGVCTALGNQLRPGLVPDGEGGAVIVWEDYRSSKTHPDIYTQRVEQRADNLIYTLWDENGIPVCAEDYSQENIKVISNEYNGIVIVWQDERNGEYDIFARIIDLHSPIMEHINNQSVNAGEVVQFRVTAADPDGDLLTYSIEEGSPFYECFEPSTGRFLWTPVDGDVGTHYITFYVSDGTVTVSQPVIIIVNDGAHIPVLNPIGTQIVNEGSLLTIDVTSANPNVSLGIIEDLPEGIIDAYFTDNGNGTGIFAWTPGYDQAGTYYLTFYATEGADYTVPPTDLKTVVVTVKDFNPPPVINTIANQPVEEGVDIMIEANEGEILTFNVEASDPDGIIPAVQVVGRPKGASFTDYLDGTGTFSWTPGYDIANRLNTPVHISVVFTASDGEGGASRKAITITVHHVNQPPTISLAPSTDQSVPEGTPIDPITITVTDPDGDIPSVSVYLENGGYAHWRLNEGEGVAVHNSSRTGSERNGTTMNMDDGNWVSGKLGNCLQFDGVNEYVDCGNIASFQKNQAFSLECWVKTDYVYDPADGKKAIIPMGRRNDIGRREGYSIAYRENLDVWVVVMANNDRGENKIDKRVKEDIKVNDGNWHHLVLSYDGTSKADGVKVYVDSELQSAYPSLYKLTGSIETVVSFAIGAMNGTSGARSWEGYIDEVVVYDRELTQNEINLRHNSGQGTEYIRLGTLEGPEYNDVTGEWTWEFTWTPNYTTAESEDNPYTLIFTATDSVDPSLTDGETITITVENTNRAPALDSIGNQEIAENSNLSFTLNATDLDGDTLTYRASGLPTGASFDPATRTFSWTPTYDQAGLYPEVTFSVTDGGLTDSEAIIITVNPVNRPPVLAVIGDKGTDENQLLEFTLNATDIDGDTLTYRASGLPTGASFDPATKTFSWTPTYDQAGSYPGVTFSVTDGGLTDSEAITITVNPVNRPPVLAVIGDKGTDENQLLEFTLNATDLDGDTLTFSAKALPEGASFDSSTKKFSWIPTYEQAGEHTNITFTVTDNGEPQLSDSETIKITVSDVIRKIDEEDKEEDKETEEDDSVQNKDSDKGASTSDLSISRLSAGTEFSGKRGETGTSVQSTGYAPAFGYVIALSAQDDDMNKEDILTYKPQVVIPKDKFYKRIRTYLGEFMHKQSGKYGDEVGFYKEDMPLRFEKEPRYKRTEIDRGIKTVETSAFFSYGEKKERENIGKNKPPRLSFSAETKSVDKMVSINEGDTLEITESIKSGVESFKERIKNFFTNYILGKKRK